MITEKTIEKHRYFTTGDDDMWLLQSVETRRVATFIRIDKPAEGTFGRQEVQLGCETSSRLVPVPVPEARGMSDEARAARDKPAANTGKPDRKKRNQVDPVDPVEKPRNRKPYRRGKPSPTGYVGVHIKQSATKGTRYIAVSPKNKYLGTYDSPELAAAARAEDLGDAAEAGRLRKLAAKKKKDARRATSDEKSLSRAKSSEPTKDEPAAAGRPESMAERARRRGDVISSNDAEISPPASPRRRAGDVVRVSN